MDAADLHAQLSTLSANLTTLESALAPLLTTPLPQLSTPLPLLSKAKLNALSAYAIESLLFSSVRLHASASTSGPADVDAAAAARSHPVFAELARTRRCFERITSTEQGPRASNRPGLRVDREAVGRFVRAGLAGASAAVGLTQQQQQRLQVHRMLQRQGEGGAGASVQQEHVRELEARGLKKRKADESADEEEEDAASESASASDAEGDDTQFANSVAEDDSLSHATSKRDTARTLSKRERRAQKKTRQAEPDAGILAEAGPQQKRDKKRWTKQEKKDAKLAKAAGVSVQGQVPQQQQHKLKKQKHKSSQAPKDAKQVFQALLNKTTS